MELTDESKSDRDVVVITGFGPFGAHTVNASMEAVKLLPTLGLEKELNITLVIKEIPVEYDYVKNNILKIWQLYKPKLMVHVGVNGRASQANLERQAFNDGYEFRDVLGCIPDGNVCVPGCENVLKSGLDMDRVCENVKASGCGVGTSVSDDPGRFLCDFIYYNSLCIDRKRSAFIHVPTAEHYSALQMAEMLKVAVSAMLRQVNESDNKQM